MFLDDVTHKLSKRFEHEGFGWSLTMIVQCIVQCIKTTEPWALTTSRGPKVTTWYVVSILTWFSVSGLHFSKCFGKRTGSIDGLPKETFLDSNGIKKYKRSSGRSCTFRGHVFPVSDDHAIRSDTFDESRTHTVMSPGQTCFGSVNQERQLQAELIHGCIICRRPRKVPINQWLFGYSGVRPKFMLLLSMRLVVLNGPVNGSFAGHKPV